MAIRGADLYHLFEQLPCPSILLGDLDRHNPLWLSDHCDSRVCLFEVFSDLNFCILSDRPSVYFHPTSWTKSVLDLFEADPSLLLEITWTVVDDVHGSDHIPVKV